MRLFYAIELTEQTRALIKDRIDLLRSAGWRGRFCLPENLHLTLQFIGECPAAWTDDLCHILAEAAAGIPPFQILIENMGTFGRHQDILWLGAAENPDLEKLVEKITCGLGEKMLPHEKRPFHSHITIGRQIHIPESELSEFTWQMIVEPVEHISLMQSRHVDNKLVYTPVYRQFLESKP